MLELNNFDETNLKTGAITIYKSPIFISNSIFKNSESEDSLNIVDSNFEIKNTTIENSKNDALDIDFSNGTINGLNVKNSGNDGLDFSRSEVKAENIYIFDAGDKGISVGEKSNINFINTKIKKSKIGLAVKDESKVLIEKNKFSISDGQKKSFFYTGGITEGFETIICFQKIVSKFAPPHGALNPKRAIGPVYTVLLLDGMESKEMV